MIGIYRIKNLRNNKCYYGSSKNIEKRFKTHLRQLKKGKHHNKHLQRSWDKHGENYFVFEVVEECNETVLLELEQKYLDSNPEFNIGIKSSGGDNLTKNPNREHIVRKMGKSVRKRYELMSKDERIEKHSKPMDKNPNWKGGTSFKYCECGVKISPINNSCINCRDKSGANNPFYGKKHSQETKNKLSEIRKGKKPTNMKQVIIENIIYESISEASRQTGVPSPTILWRINSKNKKYENYQSHPTIKEPLSN
jgi:group I intron endonuclease